MSENMIERVAIAMHDATPFKATAGAFEYQPKAYKDVCRTLARAAIEAMREPTADMITCGEGHALELCEDPQYDTEARASQDPWWPSTARTYRAMIDAILSHGDEEK